MPSARALARRIGAEVIRIREEPEQLALGPSSEALTAIRGMAGLERQAGKRLRVLYGVAGGLLVLLPSSMDYEPPTAALGTSIGRLSQVL